MNYSSNTRPGLIARPFLMEEQMGYTIIDDEEATFIMLFNEIASGVHETAKEKGFWDKPRNDGECLMLMVTELCEGFEALRNNDAMDDKIPEFKGIEAELADEIIRIMDYAVGKKLRVVEALIAKMKMNKTREHMHGNKKF